MAFTEGLKSGAGATVPDRLRDIEAVTDAALSRLDEQALLETLLERVKKTLQADMALHRSLVPAALPEVQGVDLAARYVTGSGNVGGDWYDVFVLPSGKLGVVVGDVVGSGLQAAVIMGRMRSALRAYVLQTED